PSLRMCDEKLPPCFATTLQSSTRSSVVASDPGGIMSMLESPSAPSFIDSSSSTFIPANCAGVGRSNDWPITPCQMLSSPTYDATFTATPDSSTRLKQAASARHRPLLTSYTGPTGYGPADVPSPSTSVVTPWRTLLGALPSSRRSMSECECMSMNPGATTSPL